MGEKLTKAPTAWRDMTKAERCDKLVELRSMTPPVTYSTIAKQLDTTIGTIASFIHRQGLKGCGRGVNTAYAVNARHPLTRQVLERSIELGMSQAELSRKAGYGQPTITVLAQGVVDPRLATLADLAEAVGLKLVLVPRDEQA